MENNQTKTTALHYNAPRAVNMGDIFYVIDSREENDFSAPCRVYNDAKELTVNGVTFRCPVCGGYRSREVVATIKHYTVATVRVFAVSQKNSTDSWKMDNYCRDMCFNVYRKRGHGHSGDGHNFTRDFSTRDLQDLNKLPEKTHFDYYGKNFTDLLFDDYQIACKAAEILNTAALEELNAFNAAHNTAFTPSFKTDNDPKN